MKTLAELASSLSNLARGQTSRPMRDRNFW